MVQRLVGNADILFSDTDDAGKYKYVLDVDGNGWSSRFKRLMTTNTLVFKSTIYAEWFTERLAPWVHYIPIQSDYSDLYDALVFFRGDLAGRGAHEELAAKIAQEGREWILAFWREEDMVAYLFIGRWGEGEVKADCCVFPGCSSSMRG